MPDIVVVSQMAVYYRLLVDVLVCDLSINQYCHYLAAVLMKILPINAYSRPDLTCQMAGNIVLADIKIDGGLVGYPVCM